MTSGKGSAPSALISHINCIYNVVCSTDWELRFVNGGSSLEGRLEVCLNGVWGTVCDTSWDDTDAGVVCSQMGYSRRGSIPIKATCTTVF